MQLRVLTLNIWGVRFIAKFIDQRLRAFVEHVNETDNTYDIIGLQEVRRTGHRSRLSPRRGFYAHRVFRLGLVQGGLHLLTRSIDTDLSA